MKIILVLRIIVYLSVFCLFIGFFPFCIYMIAGTASFIPSFKIYFMTFLNILNDAIASNHSFRKLLTKSVRQELSP